MKSPVWTRYWLGHYRMRGVYAIQTQADFEAWLAHEATLLQ